MRPPSTRNKGPEGVGGEERHDVGIGSTGRGTCDVELPQDGECDMTQETGIADEAKCYPERDKVGECHWIQRMLANVLAQDKAAASERQALNEYRHPGGNAELDMQGQDRQAGPGESGDKAAVPIAEGEGFGLDGQAPQEGGRSTEFNTGTSVETQERDGERKRRVSPRRRKEGPEAKVGLCQSSDVPIATSLHNEQICMRSNGDSEREGRLLEAGGKRKMFERTSTGKRDPTAGVTVQEPHVGQGEEEPVHVFSGAIHERDSKSKPVFATVPVELGVRLDATRTHRIHDSAEGVDVGQTENLGVLALVIQHLEMEGDWTDAGQAKQREESAVRRTEAKPGGEDGHGNIFPVQQRTWIGGRDENLRVQPRRPRKLLFRRHNHKHGVDVPRDPLPGAGEREGAIGYSGFAFASEKLDHQRDLLAFDAVATAALDYKYGLRLILESVRERNAMHSCISQRKLYADELERRSEELEWLLQAVGISWSLSEDAEPPMHCRRAWDAASSLLIADRVSRSPSDNVELGLCVSEQHGIGEPGRETSGQTKKTIHGGR
ncbi:hypothetical protein C8R47DRAFT_1069228 [Mycena vitilis]|nr:hypothetical protein C8R47DRAFT_1069228 [Mycena vitilis]